MSKSLLALIFAFFCFTNLLQTGDAGENRVSLEKDISYRTITISQWPAPPRVITQQDGHLHYIKNNTYDKIFTVTVEYRFSLSHRKETKTVVCLPGTRTFLFKPTGADHGFYVMIVGVVEGAYGE